MNRVIVWLVVCTMLLVGLFACGGGGGGSSPTNNTVSGIASKGPLMDATVTVYALDASGVQGAVLATALTGASGDYTANIGSYTGSILAVVSRGTYTDEATLSPMTNTAQLRAAMTNVTGNVSMTVTPLTEIAVQRAGTLTSANIESANALVSNMIGGVNIITTQPANVLVSSSSTTAEKNYGLALAAISQMVSSGTATSVSSAISQIANDLADNKLDTTGGNISSALNTFIASSNNQTGLKTTTAAVVQAIINATTGPIGGVRFPNYQPGVSSNYTWTYQWTLWSLPTPTPASPFSTASGSTVTVNYLSGALSGRLIGMPWGGSFIEYNDGTTFKILGFNDGVTTTYITTDCNMTAPHPGYSYDTVYNGMIKDQTASYFVTGGTCTGPDNTQKILFTVQDVTVHGVLYHNTILYWYIDLQKGFKDVSNSQFTTMGIISPTGTQTGGNSLTALDIYAPGIGVVASAEIEAASGALQNLAEMTSYASNSVLISGFTGTAGLTVTARHPSDINNSSPIAQTVSVGTGGSFNLSVPYGSDFYLNYSGTAGTTPYASVNSRIWRNITATPDLSQATGEALADIPLTDANNIFNNSICGSTACSTTGIVGKGWLLIDTDSSPAGSNHIGGVSFTLTPTPVFFGYNNDSTNGNILIPPPSLTQTVAGTVNFQISSAGGYFNSATIVTVTASKAGAADQTIEFPIVPGEITYKEVRF